MRDKQNKVIGVGQLVQFTEEKTELALVVSDHLQGKGLGSKLMDALIQLARDKELKTLILQIDQGNTTMLGLAQKFQFELRGLDEYTDYLTAELKL